MDLTFSLASRLLQLLFPQAYVVKDGKKVQSPNQSRLFGKQGGLSLASGFEQSLQLISNKSYRGEKSQGK
jgi:hypothetical protein